MQKWIVKVGEIALVARIPASGSADSRRRSRFRRLSVLDSVDPFEAIAVLARFNAEGGSKNFRLGTRRSESCLHQFMRPVRGHRRPRDGFFLRAESYFNVGTEIERLDEEPGAGPRIIDGFGGVSLLEQSHGESFLALATHRFRGEGLYILDEPEAALSPQRQLALLGHGTLPHHARLPELSRTLLQDAVSAAFGEGRQRRIDALPLKARMRTRDHRRRYRDVPSR